MLNRLLDIKSMLISNILSFISAIFCTIFMYKYDKTKDNKWFVYAAYAFAPYLLIDTCLNLYIGFNETKEYILHHILSIIFICWGIVSKFGMENVPSLLHSSLQFETSTIFLNIRKWIIQYLKFVEENKDQMMDKTTLTNIVKCINPINELLFFTTFVYYRFYKFGHVVLFNSEIYVKLFNSDKFHYINRLIILLIYVLYLLNIYWAGLMIRKGIKILHKLFKNNTDPELLLIEKLKAQILETRNNLVI